MLESYAGYLLTTNCENCKNTFFYTYIHMLSILHDITHP